MLLHDFVYHLGKGKLSVQAEMRLDVKVLYKLLERRVTVYTVLLYGPTALGNRKYLPVTNTTWKRNLTVLFFSCRWKHYKMTFHLQFQLNANTPFFINLQLYIQFKEMPPVCLKKKKFKATRLTDFKLRRMITLQTTSHWSFNQCFPHLTTTAC